MVRSVIFAIELFEGFGTIRQLDGIIRVEETIPCGDIIVNEMCIGQVFQRIGQLIGEENVASRSVVELFSSMEIVLNGAEFGIFLNETQTIEVNGTDTREMLVLQPRDEIQLAEKSLSMDIDELRLNHLDQHRLTDRQRSREDLAELRTREKRKTRQVRRVERSGKSEGRFRREEFFGKNAIEQTRVLGERRTDLGRAVVTVDHRVMVDRRRRTGLE